MKSPKMKNDMMSCVAQVGDCTFCMELTRKNSNGYCAVPKVVFMTKWSLFKDNPKINLFNELLIYKKRSILNIIFK